MRGGAGYHVAVSAPEPATEDLGAGVCGREYSNVGSRDA